MGKQFFLFKLELCFKTFEYAYEMCRLDKFREVSVEMFQCIARCDCETVVQFLVLICFFSVCLFVFFCCSDVQKPGRSKLGTKAGLQRAINQFTHEKKAELMKIDTGE